jgi:cysteinyl-tRNA synthetase
MISVADARGAIAPKARKKEWKKADLIRQELLAHGILLEDTSQGTIWKVK